MIGKTRWEAVGINPDETADWGRHRDDMQARRQFWNSVFEGLLRDGMPTRWRSNGVPCFDDAGALAGSHGSTSEITTEKEANLKLELSEVRGIVRFRSPRQSA